MLKSKPRCSVMTAVDGARLPTRVSPAIQAEILPLRHQLNILRRATDVRRRLRTSDHVLWVWLSRIRPDCHSAMMIVKPETVFLCLLSQFAVPFGARQGFARNERTPATLHALRCRHSHGRRAASSLRATGSLTAYSYRRSNGLARKIFVPRSSMPLDPQVPGC